TPEAAIRLIRTLEQAQTDVAQLGKPPARPQPETRRAPSEPLQQTVTTSLLGSNGAEPPSVAIPPRRSLGVSAPIIVRSSGPTTTVSGIQNDPARQALEREREVLEREREAFTKERTAYVERLRGDPSERVAAQKQLQASTERWTKACQRWSEACKAWSDVCGQR